MDSSADKLEHLSSYYQSIIALWIKSLNEYKVEDYESMIEKLQD